MGLEKNVQVMTDKGPVVGKEIDGVSHFLGIPYAAPPIGKLRFKAPQPHESWEKPRECFQYSDRCPVLVKWQTMYPEGDTEQSRRFAAMKRVDVGNMDLINEGTYSEDCLYLNIWTGAKLSAEGEKRPVLFWLHGGGFMSGCVDASWHDGTNLAKKHGAVLVTISHRLNLFGYMDLRKYGKEYEDSPNVGMLDVIAALEWVHRNIGQFGGDPEKVLVFGESGGAMKTNMLYTMPAAKGLFRAGVAMSGAGPLRERDNSALAEEFLQRLHIKPEEIEKIQEVSTEELLEVYAQMPQLSFLLAPVRDGKHVVGDPGDPACADIIPDAAYCIGTMRDDARLTITDFHLCDLTWEELPELVGALGFEKEHVEEIIERCKANPDRPVDASDVYHTLNTEISFRKNSIAVAEAMSRAGKVTYMYLFTRESPSKDGRAVHGSEIPFFFDNIEKAPYDVFGEDDHWSRELSEIVPKYLIAFANTGRLEPEGLPQWEQYDAKDRKTMIFGPEKIEMSADPLKTYREVMEYYKGMSIGL